MGVGSRLSGLHTARVIRRRAIGATLIFLLAACSSPEPTPSPSSAASQLPSLTPIVLTGTVLLWDEVAWPVPDPGARCGGMGAWDDITGGGSVLVLDPAGNDVAAGHLDPGARGPSSQCVFTFFVEGLPDMESYRVLIGDQEPQDYSREELEGLDWDVNVRLGYE